MHTNVAVSIVGWRQCDNGAEGDECWLVHGVWGNDFGDNGYYYLRKEDVEFLPIHAWYAFDVTKAGAQGTSSTTTEEGGRQGLNGVMFHASEEAGPASNENNELEPAKIQTKLIPTKGTDSKAEDAKQREELVVIRDQEEPDREEEGVIEGQNHDDGVDERQQARAPKKITKKKKAIKKRLHEKAKDDLESQQETQEPIGDGVEPNVKDKSEEDESIEVDRSEASDEDQKLQSVEPEQQLQDKEQSDEQENTNVMWGWFAQPSLQQNTPKFWPYMHDKKVKTLHPQ